MVWIWEELFAYIQVKFWVLNMIVKQHISHSRDFPLVPCDGVNLSGAVCTYSSKVVILKVSVQIWMRSNCQVKLIKVNIYWNTQEGWLPSKRALCNSTAKLAHIVGGIQPGRTIKPASSSETAWSLPMRLVAENAQKCPEIAWNTPTLLKRSKKSQFCSQVLGPLQPSQA